MSCCTSDVIEVVQYDTRPTLQLVLYDACTNDLMDLSDPLTMPYFLLRQVGQANAKEKILMQKLPGIVGDDGTVTYPPEYDVPGSGGRCEVHWTATSFDTAGSFEGRSQVVWNDGTQQTTEEVTKITVKAAWGPAP